MRNQPDAKRLNAAKQRLVVRYLWPSLSAVVNHGTLTIAGIVRPTGITRAYRIRIVHREGHQPTLHVESPTLCRRPEEPSVPIPHTYESDKPGHERPCVYLPNGREWHEGKPIAKTVVPWLLCWLVDYEIWHATGKWLGGGIDHGRLLEVM